MRCARARDFALLATRLTETLPHRAMAASSAPPRPLALITGAAGKIGTAITSLLREAGYSLRLLDLNAPSASDERDEVIVGSVLDAATMAEAVRGVDVLVHLAGHASERAWTEIMQLNVESARIALETARDAKAGVVVLASSVHSTGFTPSDEAEQDVVPPRPDCFYGVSKVVIEALGSLFADRFGMCIVSARIMSFQTRPRDLRQLSTMLSPADFVRLIVAAHRHAPVGHHVVWAVSANTRRTVSLEAGRRIGFEPEDDAEVCAEELARELGYGRAADLPSIGSQPLGGFTYTTAPLGETWDA